MGLVCLVLSGCGYQFAGKETLPGGIHTLAVHVVANRSRHTGLEATVTSALVQALTQYNPGLVVDADRAQGVLSGTVVAMNTDVVARISPRQVVQRRVTLTLSLILENTSGDILWRNDRLRADESYYVSDDPIGDEVNRRDAIEAAARRVAEEAFNGIVHGF